MTIQAKTADGIPADANGAAVAQTAIRHAIDPRTAAAMGTDELRANFLISDLFRPGQVALTYTHYDRMIIGGAMPLDAVLSLEAIRESGTKNFLDRRELVAINIGGAGSVVADGQSFAAGLRDMVYVGMGTRGCGLCLR